MSSPAFSSVRGGADPRSGRFIGEMELRHTVLMHRGVPSRRVQAAGICFGDVSQECRGYRAVTGNERREILKKSVVGEMTQLEAKHETACLGAGSRRAGSRP